MKIQSIQNDIAALFDIGNGFFTLESRKDLHAVCDRYFSSIIEEVHEAKEEFNQDNAIYLEDELGDIFWNYITLLMSLKRMGYIRSVQDVFSVAREKYTERSGFLQDKNGIDPAKYWQETKKRQKKRLKQRHKKLYNLE